MKPRLAILDDQPRMADVLAMVLEDPEQPRFIEVFYEPGAFLAAHDMMPFDLLVTDLKMPEMEGVEVMRRACERSPGLKVIVITAFGTVETAVQAMKQGAVDYLTKPIDNALCRATVERALELSRLERENRHLRAQVSARFGVERLVANSSAMETVLDLALRAARSKSTVLITGESGTGKEMIARAIHVHSDRVGGPFVAINCNALAEGVLESELFGHEKGAYTGALSARPGLFEQAHGGTLFLDEIADVGLAFQAKLLRVLQEREVRRVGANQTREVDVRVVAATNKNMAEVMAEGRFREDLYYRLAVIPIHLQPLRERVEDILPLARRFLVRDCAEQGRELTGWSEDVQSWMLSHTWPGNVRELENTIERGVVLARGHQLELEDILIPHAPQAPGSPASTAEEPLQDFVDRMTAERVRAALHRHRGVRVDAAQELGVERTTLYRLMKRFDIS